MHPGLAQNVLKHKGISMIYVSKNQKKAESKKSREAYLELELLASANRNKCENLLRGHLRGQQRQIIIYNIGTTFRQYERQSVVCTITRGNF